MAERQAYLIVGNGIASVTATEILRAEDTAADVTVIADDLFPAFYRPALKDYLAGRVAEDKLWARPNSYYQDASIRFLSDRVVGIQAAQHTVQLQSGRQVGYHRLLLAHGARASRLNCPGMNLNGVHTLRTIADYQAVQRRLDSARRIVVSGSGTLALETIETLRHRGFKVTHLLRRRTLWSEILDPTASDLVLQQERRDGVDIRFEEEIAEITGVQGEVSGVVTNTGARIPCDIVILAIGIEPNIDFVKRSGIACGRGVRVDAAMRTSAPDIYAAGDILETTDAITGQARVIGQWYPAIQQARAAAYSMLDVLDTGHPFRFGAFYNATFLYGLEFASVGLTQLPKKPKGYQELVADPQPRAYRKVILKGGVIVGAMLLGDRSGALLYKRAIDHGVNLLPVAANLFGDDFNFKSWLDAHGVPAPVLGANRAGAGAVKQVAYAEGTRRDTASQPQPPTEAWLVPAGTPQGAQASQAPHVSATRLSETRTMTIGRMPGVYLHIDEATISRRHAEISFVNARYALRDLGSANGTFVNERRLEANSVHLLQPGDRLRIGKNVTLLLEMRQVTAQERGARQQARVGLMAAANFPGGEVPAGAAAGLAAGLADEAPTRLQIHEGANQRPLPLGRPAFNHDGSLTLPGAASPLPASAISFLKESPVLITVTHGAPDVFPLKQGKRVILGRDRSNDIVLAEMMASRKHAEVYPAPDGYYVRDLGSANGVIVNQARIDSPYHLTDGDRITIANIMIYFMQQYDAISAQPPGEISSAPAAEHGEIRCRNCGTPMSVGARFCSHCGAGVAIRATV